jgi:hypothetical protein
MGEFRRRHDSCVFRTHRLSSWLSSATEDGGDGWESNPPRTPYSALQLTLVANAYYWAGPPKLRQIVFSFVPDPGVSHTAI